MPVKRFREFHKWLTGVRPDPMYYISAPEIPNVFSSENERKYCMTLRGRDQFNLIEDTIQNVLKQFL